MPEKTREERAQRMVVLASAAVFVGMLFSYKLTSRFAVSNVFQLAGTVMLLSAYPRLLKAKDILIISLGIVSLAVAAAAISVEVGYTASLAHSLYFLLATIHLFAVYRACKEKNAGPWVVAGVRLALPVALAVLVVNLGLERVAGNPLPNLGFDDKSHAAVAACVLAFSALRFMRSPLRLLMALAFFGISLVASSRLPFIMLPFFLVAFAIEYRKVRSSAVAAWQVYLTHLLALSALAIPVLLARHAWSYFSLSFDRVLEPTDVTNSSTSSHIDLLRLGWAIKVDSISNFVLGITPGGFAPVAARSDIDLSMYRVPVGAIYDGTAPLHSAMGSIFLEFPLWVAICFVVFCVRTAWALVKRHEAVLALFFVGFMGATMWYSSHNELYFFAALTVIVAGAHNADPLAAGEPSVAMERPARVRSPRPIPQQRPAAQHLTDVAAESGP